MIISSITENSIFWFLLLFCLSMQTQYISKAIQTSMTPKFNMPLMQQNFLLLSMFSLPDALILATLFLSCSLSICISSFKCTYEFHLKYMSGINKNAMHIDNHLLNVQILDTVVCLFRQLQSYVCAHTDVPLPIFSFCLTALWHHLLI